LRGEAGKHRRLLEVAKSTRVQENEGREGGGGEVFAGDGSQTSIERQPERFAMLARKGEIRFQPWVGEGGNSSSIGARNKRGGKKEIGLLSEEPPMVAESDPHKRGEGSPRQKERKVRKKLVPNNCAGANAEKSRRPAPRRKEG